MGLDPGPNPDSPFLRQPVLHGLGKIAALGIKVSRNCTYHGVALNVAMDLEPFSRINPCGYAGAANGGPFYNRRFRAAWDEAADVLGRQARHLPGALTPPLQ